MRKSVVDRVGGQRDLDHTHDMEMWLRLSAHADVAYVHGADQAWHREHANSLSARKVDFKLDLFERKAAIDLLFLGMKDANADFAGYREAAMRALADQAIEFVCVQIDRGRDNEIFVRELLDFAKSAVPDLDTLPAMRGLAWRLKLGPNKAKLHPLCLMARTQRRARRLLRQRRWHRDGEF